jgi:hypothetical protein
MAEEITGDSNLHTIVASNSAQHVSHTTLSVRGTTFKFAWRDLHTGHCLGVSIPIIVNHLLFSKMFFFYHKTFLLTSFSARAKLADKEYEC